MEGNNMLKTKTYRHLPTIVQARQAKVERTIHTLEGDMKAHPGDYIVTGTRGESWPVRKDIFEKTYEEVKEEAHEGRF